jgi:hypothetical protein
VLPWRQRGWRQALGPFSEIFSSGAYLRKSFEKRAKKQKKKDGVGVWGVPVTTRAGSRMLVASQASVRFGRIFFMRDLLEVLLSVRFG